MITKESENFDDEWYKCLEVIEEANLAMGREHSADEKWIKEMYEHWIETPEPEAEADLKLEPSQSLMGRFEKWSQIRHFLWEHYCPDDGIRHQHELDSLAPWESDDSDQE